MGREPESGTKASGIGALPLAMTAGSPPPGLSIVRNALMITIIGARLTSTAFNTANTLPSYSLLQGGLLTTLFLPQLTKAMARPDGGRSTVNTHADWSFVIVRRRRPAVGFAAPTDASHATLCEARPLGWAWHLPTSACRRSSSTAPTI